jgi:hypothetical protein
METVAASETQVIFYQTTQRHIPEDNAVYLAVRCALLYLRSSSRAEPVRMRILTALAGAMIYGCLP